jgi:hypothetical protein
LIDTIPCITVAFLDNARPTTLSKGDVLLILRFEEASAKNYGISINSRRNGSGSNGYPAQSIAIIDLNQVDSPVALFGHLGSV